MAVQSPKQRTRRKCPCFPFLLGKRSSLNPFLDQHPAVAPQSRRERVLQTAAQPMNTRGFFDALEEADFQDFAPRILNAVGATPSLLFAERREQLAAHRMEAAL